MAWNEPIGLPNWIRVFGVVDCHVEAPLGAADLLGRQGDRGQIESAPYERCSRALLADEASGGGGRFERACFRVWSIVAGACGRALGAEPSTAKRLTPHLCRLRRLFGQQRESGRRCGRR